jgi:long-subunit acyl-CoA synthetase (AMP-forming)/acyl carrier protein
MKSNLRLANQSLRLLQKSPQRDFQALFEILFRYQNRVFAEWIVAGDHHSISYFRAKERCLATAEQIKKMTPDLPPDSLLGLAMGNSPSWIYVFWGILAAGYRPFLVNLQLGGDIISKLLQELGVHYVIGQKTYGDAISLKPEDLIHGVYHPQTVTERWGNEVLLSSSGTSATPKVFGFEGSAFAAEMLATQKILKENPAIDTSWRGRGKQLCFLPLYHIFGLEAVYFFFAFLGQTFVFLPFYTPTAILEVIKREGITELFAVPLFYQNVANLIFSEAKREGMATYQRFLDHLEKSRRLQIRHPSRGRRYAKRAFREVRSRTFGESLSFCINGGGHLSQEAISLFAGLGYPIHNGYGMTELGVGSVDLSKNLAVLEKNTIGHAFQGLEYRIADPNEAGVGELLARGPMLFSASYENGVRKPRDPEGFFPTGDLAKATEDGFLLLGRKDEVVVDDSGELVSPEIEESRFSSPYLQLCAFLRVEGKNILFLWFKKESTPEQRTAALASFFLANDSLPLAFRIREFREASTLPTTLGFKIRYSELAGQFAMNPERFPCAKPPVSDAAFDESSYEASLQKVRFLFAETLHKDLSEVTPDSSFFDDLKGTSMDYYSLRCSLNEAFNVPSLLEEEKPLSTPKEFAKRLSEGKR